MAVHDEQEATKWPFSSISFLHCFLFFFLILVSALKKTQLLTSTIVYERGRSVYSIPN
jgi:hypothetical protein